MIIAHHIILTGYGHWLPNDPRGSLSKEFRSPQLRALGEIHFGRKASQPSRRQIRDFYSRAEHLLKHRVLWFDRAKSLAVGDAFGQVIQDQKLTCYACAVLSNHAHLLIRRHRLRHIRMAAFLKEASRKALVEVGVARGHPVWSEDSFVAFKDDVQAVRTAVRYIYGNFEKHGVAAQEWGFVVPYDDWPHHKRRPSRV